MTEHNVASMPEDWWAWDGDNLHPLGIHDDFEGACEADSDSVRNGMPSCWIFSRESLTDFVEKAVEELNAV